MSFTLAIGIAGLALIGQVNAQARSLTPVTGAPLADPFVYSTPAEPMFDYGRNLHLSHLFYHSQISGELPYHRLAWRSHSCRNCTGQYGEDLSKGWYEAANSMKWGLPYGFTLSQLALNVYLFPEGFTAVDEMAEAVNWVKWGADYLMGATQEIKNNRFVGQLGDSAIGPISKVDETSIDFNYWGPPEFYDEQVPLREQFSPKRAHYVTPENPSSEIAGEYGAALAAASVVLRQFDAKYADQLVERSIQMFNFATKYPGTYAECQEQWCLWASFWYKPSNWRDEVAWNAGWLYAATKSEEWKKQAQDWYVQANGSWYEYSWDDKGGPMHVLYHHLFKDEPSDPPSAATNWQPTGSALYKANLEMFLGQYMAGGRVGRTPRGLIYFEHWGSCRYAANIAFAAMSYAKDLGLQSAEAKPYVDLATQQANYILGEYGYSWIVGVDKRMNGQKVDQGYPLFPYHKSSYNAYIDYPLRNTPDASPANAPGKFEDGDYNSGRQGIVFSDFDGSLTAQRFTLWGAVVGGPDSQDNFADNRKDYEYTEVTQDYNAAWTGLQAALIEYYGADKFKPTSDCDLDLGWNHPNAGKIEPIGKKPDYPTFDCYHTCNKDCPRVGDAKTSNTKFVYYKQELQKDNIDADGDGKPDGVAGSASTSYAFSAVGASAMLAALFL